MTSHIRHPMVRLLFWVVALLSATRALGATSNEPDSPAVAAAAPATDTEVKASAASKLTRFFPGDSLTLVRRDSTRVSGVFLDLGHISLEEYRSRYDDWRRNSSDGAAMPEINSSIELGRGITSNGKVYFNGLDYGGVFVRKGRGPMYLVSYDRFSRMYLADRHSVDSRRLKAISRNPGTPLLTTLEIRVAADTVAVRMDDVLAVQSNASPESSDHWTSRYTFSSSAMPRTTAAVQMGWLYANDPSDLGLTARGIYVRISPTFARARVGADFGVGIVADQTGDGGTAVDLSLSLCTTVPMGKALGLAPRAGVGFLLGGGAGFANLNVGTGLFVRLSRGFGFRTDYTYGRLQGCENCNYHAISTLQVGPFWGY